jgi:hypothetical protein
VETWDHKVTQDAIDKGLTTAPVGTKTEISGPVWCLYGCDVLPFPDEMMALEYLTKIVDLPGAFVSTVMIDTDARELIKKEDVLYWPVSGAIIATKERHLSMQ